MVLVNADPVIENFHFLKLELYQQIKRSSLYLVSHDVKSAVTLVDHNDYLINMTTVVKNHCIKGIVDNMDERAVLMLRNIYDITSIFSSIGFTIVELLRHTSEDTLQYLKDDAFTEQLFSMVLKAISRVDINVDGDNKYLGHQLSDMAEEMQEVVAEYAEHITNLHAKSIQENDNSSLPYVISMFTNIALNLVRLSEAVLSIEQNKVVTIRQFQALKAALKKVGGNKLVTTYFL